MAALVLATLMAAACGGGGSGGGDRGRPPGADGASKVQASCDAIADIKSYRYSISLKLQSPALGEAGKGTPADPLGAFAQALTALFSDMEMEGAYVAPDRSLAILRFQDEEMELRSIGDKSWVRIGTTWQEQASAKPGTLLTPRTICEDIVKDLAPSLKGLGSRRERVNGIETDHYRLDEADLKRLPDLLGSRPESPLPQRFAVDMWLARDGLWPVRLRIGASDTDETGQPLGLELSMEFRDINDPAIEIDPPMVSPAQA